MKKINKKFGLIRILNDLEKMLDKRRKSLNQKLMEESTEI